MQKSYDHQASEDKIYKNWEQSGAMRADEKSSKKAFTIPLPPPNVTGQLHLGHAAMLAIEDILIRYKKMTGHESLWIPGTDHAAIATENVVLKHLGAKSREEYSREEFLEHCRDFASDKHDIIVNQMKKMGAWLDWSREAYTFDDERNFAVNKIFKQLYEDGLIVRGHRLINWSVGAQSVLADDEVEWEERKEPFYYIRCGEFIMGTVRSETKCADSPVVVHPEGEYVRVKFTQNPPNPPLPRGAYRKGNFPYLDGLKERARELRKNATIAERTFWKDILKSDVFSELTFLRQKPIDQFIVDFYCSQLGLVIEIDGDVHKNRKEYDQERSTILEERFGLLVLRYSNDEVLNNLEKVKDDLISKIKQREFDIKNLSKSPLGKGDLGDLKNTKTQIPPTPFVKGEPEENIFILSKNLFENEEKRNKMLNLLDPEGTWEVLETKQGKEFVGQSFEYETYAGKRQFHVIADEVIDMEKGTGAMTISCNHSADDYDLGKRLKLDEFFFDKIDFEGKMKDIAGPCAGMTIEKARKESAKIMKTKGLLVGEEKTYSHRTPLCYRSGCVVEPMVSPQWFVAVEKEFETKKLQKVVFVRHGQSEENAQRIVGGQSAASLTEKGRTQARETAQQFKTRKISKIIASDLNRAKETAEQIKKELNIDVKIELWDELREADYGDLTGRPSNDKCNIERSFEAKTGETLEQLFERAKKVWEKLQNLTEEDGEVIVVSHKTFLSFLFAIQENVKPENYLAFRYNWKLKNSETVEIGLSLDKTEITTLKKLTQDAVRNKHVKIIPERFEKIYFQWIDNLHDWCISRQIWWGHQIPVWYDENDQIHLPKEQKIILGRHGKTSAAENGFVQGKDDSLNEEGVRHAEDLARAVEKENITKIISSDHARAKETAEIVAKKFGLEIEVWKEFGGIDFGEINGTPVEKGNPALLRAMKLGTGETAEGVFKRVKQGCEKLKTVSTEGNVLVVAHRTILSAIDTVRAGRGVTEFLKTRKRNDGAGFGVWGAFSLFKAPEGKNLRQDEDTLDTWFSSALWPFSTIGWPNENEADFQKFYPNDVLETGHDILFFWVARMIMFGRYATGKYPFHTVYLHGLVTDEKGKKMSKSKGNGIDPLVMIEKFGADPVRLALVIGSTPGQKIPIGEAKISGYRNFVNKLWNAGRFVQMQLAQHNLEAKDREATPKSLSDKWIAHRFGVVEKNVRKSLESYNISKAGEAIYHFVWDEFCDWYLEGQKVDPNPQFLTWLYTEILKLLHPLCPFVTEEIYTLFEGKDQSLMALDFPAYDFEDQTSADLFETIQKIVSEIRKVRAEKKLNPKEKIVVKINSAEPVLAENEAIIKSLANLSELEFGEQLNKPEHAVTILVEGFEIFVEIPFDEAAEKARMAKEQEQLEKQIAGLEGRLSNKSYTEKAPAHLVEQTKSQLEEAKKALEKLMANL